MKKVFCLIVFFFFLFVFLHRHVPQVKATTVADTPEARRLAENTRIQSQVKYHEDFEKSKGRVTQVADDPETQRMRNNSKIISNVAYHGDLEKKKQMEQLRVKLDEGTLFASSFQDWFIQFQIFAFQSKSKHFGH